MLASIEAKKAFISDPGRLAAFGEAVSLVLDAYGNGGRLYIAGNGGSAADAQHLAAELVCRYSKDRPPLAAEAFTTDTSTLTAIGNDYGYESLFSRQVEAKARPGDVFLGVSTSGRSPNIIAAFRKCRQMGVKSILFTGGDGGEAKNHADITVIAHGSTTNVIQEQHIVMVHALCACVEDELFGDGRGAEIQGG